MRRLAWFVAAVAVILGACGSPPVASVPTTGAVVESTEDLGERMEAIELFVSEWRTATSLEDAQKAAEGAANLVVGPEGPGYGDRDGDGVVQGESGLGVLPGLAGTPDGTATSLESNKCVAQDVLGGSWSDPTTRWDEMLSAIDAWRPNNNTMPTLASHPMRIVGWATFTLATESLEEAREYAGHAKLHVDVSVRALECSS